VRAPGRMSDAVRDGTTHGPLACVEVDLIDIAPAPVLARLKRSDDRVTGAPEMSGGVLVRRAVAAAHVAANHAESEVNPRSATPQAVVAAVGARGDGADLVEVGASRNHSTERTPPR